MISKYRKKVMQKKLAKTDDNRPSESERYAFDMTVLMILERIGSLYMEDINLLGRSVILRSDGVSGFRSMGGAEVLRSRSRGGGRCGGLGAA